MTEQIQKELDLLRRTIQEVLLRQSAYTEQIEANWREAVRLCMDASSKVAQLRLEISKLKKENQTLKEKLNVHH
jgi:uncharacterized protein Yka (UPF0111/DUF47 family)